MSQLTSKLTKGDLLKVISDFIDSNFGGTKRESAPCDFTKSVDEEQRLALFVAMSPDEYDAHGMVTSADVIEKACHNFNQHCMTANLFHRVETENAVIVESYINRVPFTLEDGREVKKGAWLQMWHFPKDDSVADTLWELVKAGEINGISIGARGRTENVIDE